MNHHFKFDTRLRLAFGIATLVIAALAAASWYATSEMLKAALSTARTHKVSDHLDNPRNYAIIMLDPRARAVTRNEGARQFKGHADAGIIGQTMARFHPTEEVAAGEPARVARSHAHEEGVQ